MHPLGTCLHTGISVGFCQDRGIDWLSMDSMAVGNIEVWGALQVYLNATTYISHLDRVVHFEPFLSSFRMHLALVNVNITQTVYPSSPSTRLMFRC